MTKKTGRRVNGSSHKRVKRRPNDRRADQTQTRYAYTYSCSLEYRACDQDEETFWLSM